MQKITRKGEELGIIAHHKLLTGHHKEFCFGFENSAQAERYERTEWYRLVRSKKWHGRSRLPALSGECSVCRKERPCVLWEDKPLCYNCAHLHKVRIRRGFADKENLRVPIAADGEVPAWEVGDIVDDSDLPSGKYFFHYTAAANLDLIRKTGLRSQTGFEKNTIQLESHPSPGESRLFLYPESRYCFSNSTAKPVPTASLRFKRSVLKDKEKIWDNGYGGKVFSCFVRDAVVSPGEIKVCYSTRWDNSKKMQVSIKWTRLVSR